MTDECSYCLEDYSISKLSKCASCQQNFICPGCADGEVLLAEWLLVPTKCDQCPGNVCRDCLKLCYDCANVESEFTVYCTRCAPSTLVQVPCKYHTWWTCGQHKDNECGECYANRNFDLKYSMNP